MHGNVSELVEDEWHDSYYLAPADGSAWGKDYGKEGFLAYIAREGSWVGRVVRGGNYHDVAYACRSGARARLGPHRMATTGFRVARTLD